MFRKLSAVIGALLLATVAACSPAQETPPVNTNAIILDVRTPEEYSDGHLEGSDLLDILSGEFHAELPNLDPHAEYLLYCRSGNRSGQAKAAMEQLGFTNVTNLGSLAEAADATGIKITK